MMERSDFFMVRIKKPPRVLRKVFYSNPCAFRLASTPLP